jgi:hypothetical protein
MKRNKLYAIRKHYAVVRHVPQQPTVSVKPTEYLLRLPPHDAIAAVSNYVIWLESQTKQGFRGTQAKKKKMECELDIAQQFLGDLKEMYQNTD